MREYEIVFIINPDGDKPEKAIEEIKKIITSAKGKQLNEEKWASKRLAYRIKNFDKGYYYLLNCELEQSTINELKKEFRLNQDILRHMFISKNA